MGRVGAGNSFQESFIFSVLHIIMESPVIPRKYFYFCGKEALYTLVRYYPQVNNLE